MKINLQIAINGSRAEDYGTRACSITSSHEEETSNEAELKDIVKTRAIAVAKRVSDVLGGDF